MEINKRNNIVWIDLLRITACFIVVFAHCCDPFVANFDNNSNIFLTGVFCGSLTRPCVPLFVMITGVLLLPLKSDERLDTFYKKRIKRILPPLIFWSLALPLMAFCYFAYINPQTANPQVADMSYTQESLLQRLSTFIFNFNFDTTPLWYLYMLIGLYLFMPFFSAWVEKRDSSLSKIYIILWGVSLLLPYISVAVSPFIFGACHWNAYGTFHYFAGFTGFMLLGHLMAKGNAMATRKVVILGTLLYFAGYIVTYTGFSTIAEQYTYAEAPELTQLFWQFCSPNVALMALGVFMIVQRVKVTSPRVQAILASTTKCSFGAYLMHYAIIGPVILVILPLGLPTPLSILCSVVAVFGICWGLTALIYKIAPKWAKYIVG